MPRSNTWKRRRRGIVKKKERPKAGEEGRGEGELESKNKAPKPTDDLIGIKRGAGSLTRYLLAVTARMNANIYCSARRLNLLLVCLFTRLP